MNMDAALNRTKATMPHAARSTVECMVRRCHLELLEVQVDEVDFHVPSCGEL